MIQEDYISFETAKLLKEKGFDEATIGYYNTISEIPEKIKFFDSPISIYDSDGLIGCIQAPTLQMAMKWLREVHSIDISIDIRFWTDDEGVDVKSWRYTVYRTDEIEDFGQSDTYEDACEEAIKYCLENLV